MVWRISSLPLPFQFINRRDGPPCDDRCVLYGSLRYINTYASFMSIASVAVSRCLGLCYPEVANRVFKHIWVSILGIWTYAIVLVVPSVSGWYGTFGYDYDLGKCDMIDSESRLIHPRALFLGIGFTLPFILIVVSYVTMWWRVVKSDLYLRQHS